MLKYLYLLFHLTTDIAGGYLLLGYFLHWFDFPRWYILFMFGVSLLQGISITLSAVVRWWFNVTDGWYPMSTAPMDGTFILATTDSGYVTIAQYCSLGYWRTNVASTTMWTNFTHWQSLPKGLIDGRKP